MHEVGRDMSKWKRHELFKDAGGGSSNPHPQTREAVLWNCSIHDSVQRPSLGGVAQVRTRPRRCELMRTGSDIGNFPRPDQV
jgi:hypothetical protein